MAQIDAIRALALPAIPLPNTLYFIKNGNKAELYITNLTGQVFPVTNTQAIRDLAAATVKFDINTPAATWTIAHNLGRVPIAEAFDINGNKILVNIHVDITYIVVEFPFASTGFVIAF